MNLPHHDLLNFFFDFENLVDLTSRDERRLMPSKIQLMEELTKILFETESNNIYNEMGDGLNEIYLTFLHLKRIQSKPESIITMEESSHKRTIKDTDTSYSEIIDKCLLTIGQMSNYGMSSQIFKCIQESLEEFQNFKTSGNSRIYRSLEQIKSYVLQQFDSEFDLILFQGALETSLIILMKASRLESIMEWLLVVKNKVLVHRNVPILINFELFKKFLCSLYVGNEIYDKGIASSSSNVITNFMKSGWSQKIDINIACSSLYDLMEEILKVQLCINTDSINQTNTFEYPMKENFICQALQLWSQKTNIQVLKPVFNKLQLSEDASSSIKQVVVTSSTMMILNNWGQACAIDLKKGLHMNLEKIIEVEKVFEKTAWYSIQFPEPAIEIAKISVNRDTENGEFVMAISKSGVLYSWGDGSHGKLGHGDYTNYNSPKCISTLNGYKIRDVSCGQKHAAAVSEMGHLLCWGFTEYFSVLYQKNPLNTKNRVSNDGESTQQNTIESCFTRPFLMPISMISQVYCDQTLTVCLDATRLNIFIYGQRVIQKDSMKPNEFSQSMPVHLQSPYKIKNIFFHNFKSSRALFLLMLNGLLYRIKLTTNHVQDPLLRSFSFHQTHSSPFEQCTVQHFKVSYDQFIDMSVIDRCITLLTHDGVTINIYFKRGVSAPENTTQKPETKVLIHAKDFFYTTCKHVTDLGPCPINSICSFYVPIYESPLSVGWYFESLVSLQALTHRCWCNLTNVYVPVSDWKLSLTLLNQLLKSTEYEDRTRPVNMVISLLKCQNANPSIQISDLNESGDLIKTVLLFIDEYHNSGDNGDDIVQKLTHLLFEICRLVYVNVDSVCTALLTFLNKNRMKTLDHFTFTESLFLRTLLTCFHDDQFMNISDCANVENNPDFCYHLPTCILPPYTNIITQNCNITLLSDLLLVLSQKIMDYLMEFLRKVIYEKYKTAYTVDSGCNSLYRTISHFILHAYQIFVIITQKESYAYMELLDNFNTLLPWINNLISVLHTAILELPNLSSLIPWCFVLKNDNSLLGGVFKMLLEKTLLVNKILVHDNGSIKRKVIGLMPLLTSMLHKLDDINRKIVSDEIDYQFIHWPLLCCSRTLGEMMFRYSDFFESHWKWMHDLERLIGNTMGCLYHYHLKKILNFNLISDEFPVRINSGHIMRGLMKGVTHNSKMIIGVQKLKKFYKRVILKECKSMSGIRHWKNRGCLYHVGRIMTSMAFNLFQCRFKYFDIEFSKIKEDPDNQYKSFKIALCWLIKTVHTFYYAKIQNGLNPADVVKVLLNRSIYIKTEFEKKWLFTSTQNTEIRHRNSYLLKKEKSDINQPDALSFFMKRGFNQICNFISYIMIDDFDEHVLLDIDSVPGLSEEFTQLDDTFETYVALIKESNSVLDSVFIQIVAGMIKSLKITMDKKITNDSQEVDSIYQIIMFMLKKLASQVLKDSDDSSDDATILSNRLSSALCQFFTYHLNIFDNDSEPIKKLFEMTMFGQNSNNISLFDCLVNIITTCQHYYVLPKSRWLVLSYSQKDDNMLQIQKSSVWICLEFFCLRMLRNLPTNSDTKAMMEKWTKLLCTVYRTYVKDEHDNILDIYYLLNLTKCMISSNKQIKEGVTKAPSRETFDHLQSMLIGLATDLYKYHLPRHILQINPINGSKTLPEYFIQYSINRMAMQTLCTILDNDSNEIMEFNNLRNIFGQLGCFSSNVLLSYGDSETKEMIDKFQVRQRINTQLFEMCDHACFSEFDWIDMNSNFDLSSICNGDILNINAVELYIWPGVFDCVSYVFLKELITGGVWKFHISIESTLHALVFRFFIVENRPRMNSDILKSNVIVCELNLSNTNRNIHRLDILVDIDQGIVLLSNGTRQSIRSFNSRACAYKFAVDVVLPDDSYLNSINRQYVALIQLVSTELLLNAQLSQYHAVQYVQCSDGCIGPNEMMIYDTITREAHSLFLQLKNSNCQFIILKWLIELIENYLNSMNQQHTLRELIFLMSMLLTHEVDNEKQATYYRFQLVNYVLPVPIKEIEDVVNKGVLIDIHPSNCVNPIILSGLPPFSCSMYKDIRYKTSQLHCFVYSLDTESIIEVPATSLQPMKTSNGTFLDILMENPNNFSLMMRLLDVLHKVSNKEIWSKNDNFVSLWVIDNPYITNSMSSVDIEPDYLRFLAVQLYTKILNSGHLLADILGSDDISKTSILKHYQSIIKHSLDMQVFTAVSDIEPHAGLSIAHLLLNNFSKLIFEYSNDLPWEIASLYVTHQNCVGHSNSRFNETINKVNKMRLRKALSRCQKYRRRESIHTTRNIGGLLNPIPIQIIRDMIAPDVESSDSVQTSSEIRRSAEDTSTSSLVSESVPDGYISDNSSNLTSYASQSSNTQKQQINCPICSTDINRSLLPHISRCHEINCKRYNMHIATIYIDVNGDIHDFVTDDNSELVYCATVAADKYIVCKDFIRGCDLSKSAPSLFNHTGRYQSEYCKYAEKRLELDNIDFIQRPTDIFNVGLLGEFYDQNIFTSNVVYKRDLLENSATVDGYQPLLFRKVDTQAVCFVNHGYSIDSLRRLSSACLVFNSRRMIAEIMKCIYRCQTQSDANILLIGIFQSMTLRDWDRLFHWIEYERIILSEDNDEDQTETNELKLTKTELLSLIVRGMELWLDELKSNQNDNGSCSLELVNLYFMKFTAILNSHAGHSHVHYGSDANVKIKTSYMFLELCTPFVWNILYNNQHLPNKNKRLTEFIELLALGSSLHNPCNSRFQIWCLKHLMAVIIELSPQSDNEQRISERIPFSMNNDKLVSQSSNNGFITSHDVRILEAKVINNQQTETRSLITVDTLRILRVWENTNGLGNLKHTFKFWTDYNQNNHISNDDRSFLQINRGFPDNIFDDLLETDAKKLATYQFSNDPSNLYIALSIRKVVNVFTTQQVMNNQAVMVFLNTISVVKFMNLNGQILLLIITVIGDTFIVEVSTIKYRLTFNKHLVKSPTKDCINANQLFVTSGAVGNNLVVGYKNGTITSSSIEKCDDSYRLIDESTLPFLHENSINNLEYVDSYKQLLISNAQNESKVGIWHNMRLFCVIDINDYENNTIKKVTVVKWWKHYEDDKFDAVFVGDNRGNVNIFILRFRMDMLTANVEKLFSIPGHLNPISCITIDYSQRLLATACQSGWIRVWCFNKNLKKKPFLISGSNNPLSTSLHKNKIIYLSWLRRNDYDNQSDELLVIPNTCHRNIKTFRLNKLDCMKQWSLLCSYISFPQTQTSTDTYLEINSLVFLKELILNLNYHLEKTITNEEMYVSSVRHENSQLVYSPLLQTILQFLNFVPNIISPLIEKHVSSFSKHLSENLSNLALINRINLAVYDPSTLRLNSIKCVHDFMKLTEYLAICNEDGNYPNESLSSLICPPYWWWRLTLIDSTDQEIDQIIESICKKTDQRPWTYLSQQNLVTWYTNQSHHWLSSAKSTDISLVGWGSNDKGQLTRNTKCSNMNIFQPPMSIKDQIIDDSLLNIICGNSFSIVLQSNHSILMSGDGIPMSTAPYLSLDLAKFSHIPALSALRISYVSVSLREKQSHVVALTVYGDAYSWGFGNHGKLGHGTKENILQPKLIEALVNKPPAVQVSCGYDHTVIVLNDGSVYSFGLNRYGQLGLGIQDHGHLGDSVPDIICRLLPNLVITDNILIGMAACGKDHTLLLSQDGYVMLAFGNGDHGKLGVGNSLSCYRSLKLTSRYQERTVKIICGDEMSGALTEHGRIFMWGCLDFTGLSNSSVCDVDTPTLLEFHNKFFCELTCSSRTVFAITSFPDSRLVGWGANRNGILLTKTDISIVKEPLYIDVYVNGNLCASKWNQVSCSDTHVLCSTAYPRPHRLLTQPSPPPKPLLIPPIFSGQETEETESHLRNLYPHLIGFHSGIEIIGRLCLILYWQELARLSWKYWLPYPTAITSLKLTEYPIREIAQTRSSIDFWPPSNLAQNIYIILNTNHENSSCWHLLKCLQYDSVRLQLFLPQPISSDLSENKIDRLWWWGASIYKILFNYELNMQSNPNNVVVKLNRISNKSHPLFQQTMNQLAGINNNQLQNNIRGWKVILQNEGADDAGGAYDESISSICFELQEGRAVTGTNQVLIPLPGDSAPFIGNMLLNPVSEKLPMVFLGRFIAIAIRTNRPLALRIDPIIWKLLGRSLISFKLLEETDVAYFSSLRSIIQSISKEDKDEYEDLVDLYGLSNWTAHSCSHQHTELIYKGTDRTLSSSHLTQYINQVIRYRSNEFKKSIEFVRNGMREIIPLPLLDIVPTTEFLERLVCGSNFINLKQMKSITRYQKFTEDSPVVIWLWEILEEMTQIDLEKFLRFVTGKSRLPICLGTKFDPPAFHIFVTPNYEHRLDTLPEAQTCFNKLRLPFYSNFQTMKSKLQMAISNCRSIDLDDYILNDENNTSI